VDASGATTRTQVAAGYGRVTPVVYAEVNEAVYFTDGIRSAPTTPCPARRRAGSMPSRRSWASVQFS
jgi:hypothetical protein